MNINEVIKNGLHIKELYSESHFFKNGTYIDCILIISKYEIDKLECYMYMPDDLTFLEVYLKSGDKFDMILKTDQLNEDIIFYENGKDKIVILTDFARIYNYDSQYYSIKEENELKFMSAIGCL